MNTSYSRLAAALFAMLSISSAGNAEELKIKNFDIYGVELGMDAETAIAKISDSGFVILEKPNSMAIPGDVKDEKGRLHHVSKERFSELRSREDIPIGSGYIFESPSDPSVIIKVSTAPYDQNAKVVSMSIRQSIEKGSLTVGDLVQRLENNLQDTYSGCLEVDHFGLQSRWFTDDNNNILENSSDFEDGYFCKNSLGLINAYHINSQVEKLNVQEDFYLKQVGFEIEPFGMGSFSNESLVEGFTVYFTDVSEISRLYKSARAARKADLEAQGQPNIDW